MEVIEEAKGRTDLMVGYQNIFVSALVVTDGQ